MKNTDINEIISYLFDRPWDEDLNDDDEEQLQIAYNDIIDKYGWQGVFPAIDQYMRTRCNDGITACNFAHLLWNYNYESPQHFSDPYCLLAYLYYRMDMDPKKYDAVDIMDGLAQELLSSPDDRSHDPFWNTNYIPEKDPLILSAVEKLRKERSESGNK
ncbi:MAG: hypothetical protein IK083_06240 [Abditibacteriota bacterium]|nr:hypothetical protein [Abditibacteriota bacterium]